VRGERLVLDHLQDGKVVGQTARRGDDLDELGLVGGDALGGLVEALGAAGAGEVVRTDQEGRAGGAEGGAELGQLRAGTLLGRLDFEINDVEAGLGGFEKDVQLGVQGPGEATAKGLAAAGGDGRDVATAGQEGLELGQRGGGFCQEVDPELNENRVFNCGLSAGKKLGRGCALDGDTQLSHAQARQSHSRRGHRIDRAGDRERHFLQLTHVKGDSPVVQRKYRVLREFGPPDLPLIGVEAEPNCALWAGMGRGWRCSGV